VVPLAGRRTQVFLERLPIISFPPDCQVLRCAFWEACMIKNEFGSAALPGQLELNKRIDTGRPANLAPGLDQSFVGRHLDMSSDDMVAKYGEGPSDLPTDLRGPVFDGQASFTKRHDSIELLGVSECFIDAVATCVESNFVMNGLSGMRNLIAPGRLRCSRAALRSEDAASGEAEHRTE